MTLIIVDHIITLEASTESYEVQILISFRLILVLHLNYRRKNNILKEAKDQDPDYDSKPHAIYAGILYIPAPLRSLSFPTLSFVSLV